MLLHADMSGQEFHAAAWATMYLGAIDGTPVSGQAAQEADAEAEAEAG